MSYIRLFYDIGTFAFTNLFNLPKVISSLSIQEIVIMHEKLSNVIKAASTIQMHWASTS